MKLDLQKDGDSVEITVNGRKILTVSVAPDMAAGEIWLYIDKSIVASWIDESDNELMRDGGIIELI